jgi:hypothetical protein
MRNTFIGVVSSAAIGAAFLANETPAQADVDVTKPPPPFRVRPPPTTQSIPAWAPTTTLPIRARPPQRDCTAAACQPQLSGPAARQP